MLEIATAFVAVLAFSWLLRGEAARAPREHFYAFVAQVCLAGPLVVYSDLRRRRAKRAVS